MKEKRQGGLMMDCSERLKTRHGAVHALKISETRLSRFFRVEFFLALDRVACSIRRHVSYHVFVGFSFACHQSVALFFARVTISSISTLRLGSSSSVLYCATPLIMLASIFLLIRPPPAVMPIIGKI